MIAGETCKLRIICNIEATAGPVASVTADLSLVGGAAEQYLSEMPDGTWRWEGEVQQGPKGAKTLTVTAIDAAGNESIKKTEVQVHVPGKAIAISAGFTHSLALKADGTVSCWGGKGSSSYHECDDMPASLQDVVAIEAGE